ncbi:MAG: sigma-70 family RNA polymerase sigma factor, partial [Bacteroidota bacterium]
SLMADIQQGGVPRERAVGSLYSQLQGYIGKGMKRYRMSEALAREAFHLALQKVVQAIEWGHFEGKSKISTYFHPIFFHRCVDILRREASHKQTSELEDYMLNLPDMAQDILRDLQAKEELHQLHSLLDQLGEKCRQLLILTEWKGESLKAVANMLGYRSAAVAGTSKNRCMGRLKALIRSAE